MIILLSPAKKIDFDFSYSFKTSKPEMLKYSKQVLNSIINLKINDLKKLMSISDSLAELNYQRFKEIDLSYKIKNYAPAILSFTGDVYKGADFRKYTEKQLLLANQKIRILSGFYGLLKAFDLIYPYRLEMGVNLKVSSEVLVDFWQEKITNQLNSEIKEKKVKLLVNLASNEYSSAIDFTKLNAKTLKIDFMENKSGKLSIIGIHSKKARGLMTSYIIKNEIEEISDIKKFNISGYKYDSKLSSDTKLVFVR